MQTQPSHYELHEGMPICVQLYKTHNLKENSHKLVTDVHRCLIFLNYFYGLVRGIE